MRLAITRGISPRLADCELTHLERSPIDLDAARAQHREYEELLAALGWAVLSLPAAEDLPDCVFVEDAAVVLPEVTVICRPGAASRRPETALVERTLARYRPLVRIEAPGTLDGGDVLRVGRTLYVGVSRRSNQAGRAQLETALAPFGYRVRSVPFRDCLHLKSAVTLVTADTLLINPRWVDASHFSYLKSLEIDPSEPFAANALLIEDAVVFPAGHPRTRTRLEAAGLHVLPVNQSELAKAEGGVTCCSLLLEAGIV